MVIRPSSVCEAKRNDTHKHRVIKGDARSEGRNDKVKIGKERKHKIVCKAVDAQRDKNRDTHIDRQTDKGHDERKMNQ